MARFQRSGLMWAVLFTREETEEAADAAAAAAILSAAIPEPVVSKAVAAYASAIALFARRALKKGKALGLGWSGLSPIPSHPPLPFYHDDDQPAADRNT